VSEKAQVVWGDGVPSAYVGLRHGEKESVAARDVTRLRALGKDNGFFFEGNGADRRAAGAALGGIQWDGSWDDLVEPERPGAFYYTLFSNGGPSRERMIRRLVAPRQTILASLIAHGDTVSHEALGGADHARLLPWFLRECGGDLLPTAGGEKATLSAIQSFVARGEELMWGDEHRRGPAAGLAKTANRERMMTIAKRPGVFFLGRDLLPMLTRILRGGAA